MDIYNIFKTGFNQQITIALSQVGIIAMLCSSPLIQALYPNFFQLNKVIQKNIAIHKQTNTVLKNLIPNGSKVMLGTSTYPYLYDRPYVSSMALYANQLLKPGKKMSLVEFVNHYSNMSVKDYLFGDFTVSERSLALGDFTHMALTDKGHGWQNIFFDPEVWGDEFTEIGILILPRQTLLRSIVASNQQNNYASSHHIFQRTGLPRNIEFHSFYPEIYELANGTLLVTTGQVEKISFYSGDDWKRLNAPEQRSKIYEYLEFINWYSASLDEKQKFEIVANIFPLVGNYLKSNDGGSCMDRGFLGRCLKQWIMPL